MAKQPISLPRGNTLRDGVVVRSAVDLGHVARAARRDQGLTQLDLAGTANTGNRFVIDLEKGKPTIQLQKTIDALALLGLELVIRKKRAAS